MAKGRSDKDIKEYKDDRPEMTGFYLQKYDTFTTFFCQKWRLTARPCFEKAKKKSPVNT
jgi:hypothetical protein